MDALRTRVERIQASPDRATHLRNSTCPYCGANLGDVESTKEHVIGRRFVPRGALNQQWNLILQACKECNQLKAALEDDLSAVSMHAPLVGRTEDRDLIPRRDAARKARGTSGVREDRGLQKMKVGGQLMPGVSLSFELVAPPSASAEQICGLAQMHIGALFYLITYDPNRQTGGWWRGAFRVMNWASRSDWGNAVQRTFAERVVSWAPRVVAETARGFFRAAIRRDSVEECWAWALEWNANYRVLGFFGDDTAVETRLRQFPILEKSLIAESAEGQLRARLEQPLPMDEDKLFMMPESAR